MPSTEGEYVLFDAGVFIGALLAGDLRHAEARPLVEAARRGDILACTTTGILNEVYAALTWQMAQPPHDPGQAAVAVRLLVEPPSMIRILPEVGEYPCWRRCAHQRSIRGPLTDFSNSPSPETSSLAIV